MGKVSEVCVERKEERREESGVTQEQERQPEQSSGSDGIEPGTLGKG